MKRFVLLLLIMFFTSDLTLMAQAQAQIKSKPDSEIIREFKLVLKGNEFLEFREKAEALKPIKAETLKTHKVYKDLIDLVKDEGTNALVRKIAMELLLYFRAESHEILGLEGDLINLLQSDSTGWYMRKALINLLPDLIAADDRVNSDKLKNAFITVLSKKLKPLDTDVHNDELKRAVFNVLDKTTVTYANIKSIVEPELKNQKSELRSSILEYLAGYSFSHRDFTENEIKNFCRNLLKSTDTDIPSSDIAFTLTLYSNLLANEEKLRLQGSDEEIFLNYLKSDSDVVIIAAARALYRVKSMNGVEKIVDRLQEVMTKNEDVRNALVDALIYMEYTLLYSKTELSPSLKRNALTLIRDKLLMVLSHPSVKGTLQKKLFDAFDLFGIEYAASDYIDLETLKKMINLLGSFTDEAAKNRLSDILTNYTGARLGANVESWVRWVKDEERKPNRKFK